MTIETPFPAWEHIYQPRVIDGPMCRRGELLWLDWMARSVLSRVKIKPQTIKSEIGCEVLDCLVIQKKDDQSLHTKMVISCLEEPWMEGMILGTSLANNPIRPFFAYAQYNQVEEEKAQLAKSLNPVDLKSPPESNSIELLLSLLTRHHLNKMIGVNFLPNILVYSNWLRDSGIASKYWS